MTDDNLELDQLFAQARQQRPALPDDLAVRIQTDAEAVRLNRMKPAPGPRPALLERLVRNLGGWQGLSGLVAASAAGVWIGFSAPAFLPDPVNLLTSQETAYFVADLGYDTSFLEITE
ncbi:hypothetical protein [Ruegeria sp. 6PALISEP08]|uniref:hypothetical protein n=1 Tax=Ruegeria sp. 6PALISEP08 TaxID=1225660 RepID=UPI000B2E0BCF|nr:hypothetical protein [Ruegeria sp. 6PALISEP08]